MLTSGTQCRQEMLPVHSSHQQQQGRLLSCFCSRAGQILAGAVAFLPLSWRNPVFLLVWPCTIHPSTCRPESSSWEPCLTRRSTTVPHRFADYQRTYLQRHCRMGRRSSRNPIACRSTIAPPGPDFPNRSPGRGRQASRFACLFLPDTRSCGMEIQIRNPR